MTTPMTTPDAGRVLDRLKAIPTLDLPGGPWYPLRALLDALGIPDYRARRVIPGDTTRVYVVQRHPWYNRVRCTAVNLRGAEALVIHSRIGLSRRRMLDALTADDDGP